MTSQPYPSASSSPNSRSGIITSAVAGSVGLISLTAFISTLWLPRGPTSAFEVGIVLLLNLLIGFAGGLILRTRWSMLLFPLVYIAVVEFTRFNAVGPTVDAPRLDNPFGMLALLVGRGFHGLIALPPLMLGAGSAITWRQARRRNSAVLRGFFKQPLLIMLAFLVGGLAVLNAIPAYTPAILGSDGKPLPGSIAELSSVTLGGQPQSIMIRGRSSELPVLLYLSGGPGQSDLPYTRVLFADLTEDFIVVSWDQRGTGKSYSALDPTDELTLAQAVADTIELSNYLRERFGEEKIYLLGESWGTTLGVLAVQQRPDLYHAWIASGQMVSQRETDRRIYWDLLALAERTGDTALAAQMQAFGEPPYRDTPYPNAIAMSRYGQLETPYTPPQAYIERGTAANLGPYGIFGSEYSFVEKVNVLRGLIDMFTIMYPQLQAIDFRRDVPQLAVPVYMLDGAAELPARRDLALEWYAMLDAPQKQLYTFEDAGHSVAFEQFAALHRILTETIVPQTSRE